MRLDKWLWAARFFKTRTLAVEAINGGRVSVNADRAKPAKELKAGDEVSIRRPPFEYRIVVKGFSERRGPPAEAAALFEETDESRARRAVLAAEMKSLPQPRFKGRPTKKTRRDYERWLRSGDDE
ncbi:MAG TPA: S4 domain-containing protein [Usitatibacter sp.]|jgi:ribosome-associated heat shock protein Hsp15|nr:S4 domain-containing protein [Usitatibacter sp.]